MKWKPTDDLESKTLDSVLASNKYPEFSCFKCRHLKEGKGNSCKAFPDGIPYSILVGNRKHDKPLPVVGQKNKIVFKPKTKK